jgi:phosphoribosylformimino-5-aminoimidazole carboxamide ribotide isomerase
MPNAQCPMPNNYQLSTNNYQPTIMDVIPAIDLLEGHCVRLYQGDYSQSQVFNENPADVAKQWVDEGATRLHVVDLDGAKAGKIVNLEAIKAIASRVSVPIQVGGGLRDRQSVQQLFNIGVQRAILGTVAVEQPELVQQLCQEFPEQIIIGIDARNGLVATRGWLETSEVLATQLAVQMQELGAAAIIYTDIHRDGTLSGPNLDALRELAAAISLPIIASGGVSSVTDLLSLLALEPQGVTGVIVGKALYTGDISLKEALQAIGPGRIQDIPPNLDFSAFA